jgi:nitroreductase/dihydropteridine reductase
MEGFDSRILDSALDLRKCGYTSSVIVALGYHSAEDFNASVPKSRWPKEKVIDRI